MKKFFSIFSIIACLSLVTFAFSSCNKDDGEDDITNTMTVRGSTLPIKRALYFSQGGEFYNLDVDTTQGDDNLHGYGGFESNLIGKTTDLSGQEFFLSFNPMSGPSIDPVIKSGTVTIKEVTDGFHIVVDCVETTGDKFYMNFLAKDESKMVWD